METAAPDQESQCRKGTYETSSARNKQLVPVALRFTLVLAVAVMLMSKQASPRALPSSPRALLADNGNDTSNSTVSVVGSGARGVFRFASGARAKSIHSFLPRRSTGGSRGTASSVRRAESVVGLSGARHLPVCHSTLVAAACKRLNYVHDMSHGSDMADGFSSVPVGSLAESLMISTKATISFLNGINLSLSNSYRGPEQARSNASVSCHELCHSIVASFPKSRMPSSSNVGCFLQGGKELICNIDLSDNRIADDLRAVARTWEAGSVPFAEPAQAVTNASDRITPNSSASHLTSEESTPEGSFAELQVDVANWFRIFPAFPSYSSDELEDGASRALSECINGWVPNPNCYSSWTIMETGEQILGCTTYGWGYQGWCSERRRWRKWKHSWSCQLCGSRQSQVQQISVMARAYVQTAIQTLADNDVIKRKWFLSRARKKIRKVLKQIKRVLNNANYIFHPSSTYWGWVSWPYDQDSDGSWPIHLGSPYINSQYVTSQIGTLTHEAAHFHPHRATDYQYCDVAACLSLSKYQRFYNADNFAFFIDDMNHGFMVNRN